jgi:RNA polymerase sigma factor (sigma-70 family)
MTALEFSYQVSNFSTGLKSFAMSLTQNREDAKDLFQETVLKALKYKDKFVDSTNLKAWLYTIMKNTFINEYRRNKISKTMMDSSPNSYLLNSVAQPTVVAEMEVNVQEITKSIQSLEDEYRVPFQLFVDGFKYKEIADELNLPIGTVKSRIFIARQKLMSDLKEFNRSK